MALNKPILEQLYSIDPLNKIIYNYKFLLYIEEEIFIGIKIKDYKLSNIIKLPKIIINLSSGEIYNKFSFHYSISSSSKESYVSFLLSKILYFFSFIKKLF